MSSSKKQMCHIIILYMYSTYKMYFLCISIYLHHPRSQPFSKIYNVQEVVVVARPVPQEEPVPPARELLDVALLAVPWASKEQRQLMVGTTMVSFFCGPQMVHWLWVMTIYLYMECFLNSYISMVRETLKTIGFIASISKTIDVGEAQSSVCLLLCFAEWSNLFESRWTPELCVYIIRRPLGLAHSMIYMINTITWHQHHLNLRPYHHLCISRNMICRVSLRYFAYAPLEGHCVLLITFAAIALSSIALPAGGVLKLDWSIGLDGQMVPSHESRMYTVYIQYIVMYMYISFQCK